MQKQTPIDRLNFNGVFNTAINKLAEAYGIGIPEEFYIIEVGYEDCNVVIKTKKGKYVAKIFSKNRDRKVIQRYSTIMEKALYAGVNHPPLIKTIDDTTVFPISETDGFFMVLMMFVEGETFFELDRAPDNKEQKLIIEQAAKIHKIGHHPSYIFDSWAIPNIHTMFDKVRSFIKPDDLKLIEQTIDRYGGIPVSDLPHCFVHGDFTKANVLKGQDGKIYILDFSVAGWYPRIQELAVISANLLHDTKRNLSLHENTEHILEIYDAIIPLTPEEKEHLYAYALAGMAMEFLGSYQEKFINGNRNKETDYWLNLGRNGLIRELG